MPHALTQQWHTGFERAALPPDDTWLSWIRVERTSGGPGLTTNGQASGFRLEEQTGGLTLQAGRERLPFRSWGLYRDSVRERCRPPGLWRFLFYIAPPGSGCSTTLTFSLRFRRSATRAFARISTPDLVEIRYGSFDIEFERRGDAFPGDRRRRTAVCHDRSLLAFQRRPPAGGAHVRALPRKLQFLGVVTPLFGL